MFLGVRVRVIQGLVLFPDSAAVRVRIADPILRLHLADSEWLLKSLDHLVRLHSLAGLSFDDVGGEDAVVVHRAC